MGHWCARSSIGLAAILIFLGAGLGNAAYVPTGDEIATESTSTEPNIVADSHLHCVALAVYFEGGSTAETPEGQRHIARVVAGRAKANVRKWGGADICDVVFYRRNGVCQFSFACLPVARRTPRGGERWAHSLAIARDELEGRSDIGERNIRYYMNPALTSDRNACRFRKEFVPVVEAGRHEFFREPTEAERTTLGSSEYAECKRYQAALEAKKRAAKALAEKRRLAALAKKKRKTVRHAGR
jgi:spore germination cell wall hydrolase CwlJ-like protein